MNRPIPVGDGDGVVEGDLAVLRQLFRHGGRVKGKVAIKARQDLRVRPGLAAVGAAAQQNLNVVPVEAGVFAAFAVREDGPLAVTIRPGMRYSLWPPLPASNRSFFSSRGSAAGTAAMNSARARPAPAACVRNPDAMRRFPFAGEGGGLSAVLSPIFPKQTLSGNPTSALGCDVTPATDRKLRFFCPIRLPTCSVENPSNRIHLRERGERSKTRKHLPSSLLRALRLLRGDISFRGFLQSTADRVRG